MPVSRILSKRTLLSTLDQPKWATAIFRNDARAIFATLFP
jgi:hypothetical protein